MSSDWTRPFEPDGHTVALYHFDEGEGNDAHDACGDSELTLRSGGAGAVGAAGRASGPRRGSSAADANLRIGPANHDKLQLRTCTEEWTVEAWVRYTGPGGKDRGQWSRTEGRRDPEEDGYTYAFICGTDEEGFSLPRGMRGGWSFILRNGATRGTREDGLIAGARFMGWVGRDPNHDTSSSLGPSAPFGWLDEDRGRFRDTAWHHVAWQFRHPRPDELPAGGRQARPPRCSFRPPGHASNRIIVNDAERCDIPFCVGGVSHSRDPVIRAGLEMGNMDGEIDELRISSVMRYPVTDRLTVIRQQPPEAGLRIPYEVRLGTDAAAGAVSWETKEGSLPAGLAFDIGTGVTRGTPAETVESRRVTIGVRGTKTGATDDHTFLVHGAARGGCSPNRCPHCLRRCGLPGRAEHRAHGRPAGVAGCGGRSRRPELRRHGGMPLGDARRSGPLPAVGPGDGRERLERSRRAAPQGAARAPAGHGVRRAHGGALRLAGAGRATVRGARRARPDDDADLHEHRR